MQKIKDTWSGLSKKAKIGIVVVAIILIAAAFNQDNIVAILPE